MEANTQLFYVLIEIVLLLTNGIAGFVSFVDLQSLCIQVVGLDCINNYVPDGDEKVCGNDGVTYDNFCFYAQSRCKNAGFVMRSLGGCSISNSPDSPVDSNDVSTTLKPPSTTHDIIAQVFCSQSQTHTCPGDLDPVCGNDGIFYRNDCEFAIAKCKNLSLGTQELENCKTRGRFRARDRETNNVFQIK